MQRKQFCNTARKVESIKRSFFYYKIDLIQLWQLLKSFFEDYLDGIVQNSKTYLAKVAQGWFSVGTCKYKLGYKSHDLL